MTGVLMTVRQERAKAYAKRLKAQRPRPVALPDVAAPTRKLEGGDVVRIADGLSVTLDEVVLLSVDEAGREVKEKATARRAQPPVEWLVARGMLSQEQAQAGRALHECYALGVCGARNSDRTGNGSKGFGLGDAQMIAIADYRRALARVTPEQRGVLVRVVAWDMPVGKVAETTRTPRRRLLELLRDGLDKVAEFLD